MKILFTLCSLLVLFVATVVFAGDSSKSYDKEALDFMNKNSSAKYQVVNNVLTINEDGKTYTSPLDKLSPNIKQYSTNRLVPSDSLMDMDTYIGISIITTDEKDFYSFLVTKQEWANRFKKALSALISSGGGKAARF